MTWKYLGKPGTGVPGVPGRDLTDEEAERYGVTEEWPTYEHVREQPSRPPDAPEPDGEDEEG